MGPQQLQQQATQAAQQGQQQYQRDIGTSQQAGGQYGTEHAQAAQANQNLNDYATYMKGAGSATNLYNQGLQAGQQSQGFDPHSLATATQNLTGTQNALYGLTQASNSSTGGFGLSGAQLGNYYASQAQPLSNQVQTQSTAVGNLQQLQQNALTQANQFATVGVQGEQATSATLNQVYQNAQNQAAQSKDQMQYFAQLAQTQGSLNAQEQAAYDSALNSYQQASLAIAQASQAYASAGLARSQTTGQNLTNNIAQQAQQYRQVPDGRGGFNYFNGATPITREQYAQGFSALGGHPGNLR